VKEIVLGVSDKVRVTDKLNDKSYDLRKPNIGELMTFQKSQKKDADDVGTVEALIDFLEGLGLPKDVSLSLTSEELTAISEAVNSAKKK